MRVPIDEAALAELRRALERARELAATIDRPPVAENENLCGKCSLAPVCLPEEERLLGNDVALTEPPVKPVRLFPADDERLILHLTEAGMRVGKRGEQILVRPREGEETAFPAHGVAALVLHGAIQISSQLIHYAASRDIAVHWLSGGGSYIGGLMPPAGVQRRLRQYRDLGEQALRESLTRRLAKAKVENQLAFLITQRPQSRQARRHLRRHRRDPRRAAGHGRRPWERIPART